MVRKNTDETELEIEPNPEMCHRCRNDLTGNFKCL